MNRAKQGLFIFGIMFVSGCAFSSFKLLKDYNSKVYHRDDFKNECPLLWYGVYENYVEEVYGAPCNIRIKKERIQK